MKESMQVGHKNPCCVKSMRTAPFNQIYRIHSRAPGPEQLETRAKLVEG